MINLSSISPAVKHFSEQLAAFDHEDQLSILACLVALKTCKQSGDQDALYSINFAGRLNEAFKLLQAGRKL